MQQTFKVPDVSCGHCKSSIEGALNPLEGVREATVDIETKAVTVEFDEATLGEDKLIDAINGAGYTVAN